MSHNNSFNNINSNNNTWNNCTIADERPKVLTWLSPLEPNLRHQAIRDRRVENVGEWVLQTEEFRSWYAGSGGNESGNAVLFCYGDPGVGKTFISSLVIDSLCDLASGQNTAVACFYFDFAAQKEQSSTSVLGALLKQVVKGLEEVPGEIAQAYEKQEKVIGGRGPQLADLVKMLQIASSRRQTFVCLDALDECVPGNRVKLLDSLNRILQESPGTRIFLTGRPHIRPEIGRRLAGRVTSLSIGSKRDDIIIYLSTRLAEDTTPDAMDSSLEAEILKKIPEDVSGIFLLVSLNIDAVLQETTVYRRRQKLSAMTDGLGLGDAYDATLGRIKGQGGEKARLGMAALMWISHAERPLKSDELCHALAVEMGSPNFNADNVPSIGTLLACCQGLVAVDKQASTVRLIHFTLHEYFRAHPDLFGAAHSTIAEVCLSYLNSRQVKAFSAGRSPDLQDTPFLGYSSLYWGVHAKRDLSDCAKQLALKLFEDHSYHISTKILLKAQKQYWYAVDFDKFSLFSGLHCASFFGIVEIVAGLVGMEGCDINQTDCGGDTPLHWAAWNGHEEVVNTLLGRDGVSPDKPDNDGRTPLYCASERGHEGAVKILLRRNEVNPDQPDNDGQSPLYCAAEGGHEGVVKILLGRDGVSPDKPDNDGRTPLHCAAKRGHEGVVKVLLGRSEVNPGTLDNIGRTPLFIAAWHGHEGVVKILLGRDDVNPDKPDNGGQTPLFYAAKNGHEGVVKILLGQKEVNPDQPDNDGQSPLYCAAEGGHERVVKMLLGRDEVSPDKPDNDGRTPLHCAAKRGHKGVVKILLGRDDVKPDKPDNCGQTSLFYAAKNGHEGVVKMLLRRDDVGPDKVDDNGHTALFCAAWHGYEVVVEMLLGRDEVNPDRPDNIGRTPFFIAACCGHERVMKMLLGRDINPDRPNINGRTPLYLASWNGKEGVVKILLGRNDVNPNKSDKDGRTPLDRATERGHQGVIALLQSAESAAPSLLEGPGAIMPSPP